MIASEAEQFVTRYLLGEVTTAEQRALEERFFTDDEWFALLLRVEARLLACYQRDELTPRERELFERHFLRSAARRRRVRAPADTAASVLAPSVLSPAHGRSARRNALCRWLRAWRQRLRG